MQKHVRNFFNAHGYDPGDWIPCCHCGATAVDIHHITFRSQGGSDDADNLAALCRRCHNQAHASKEFNESLRKCAHIDS